MPTWFWVLIVLFVAVDSIVVLTIVRRSAKMLGSMGLDVARLRDITQVAEQRIVSHMEGSYGGDLEQLPHALEGAVAIARQVTEEQHLTIDDHGLRLMVTMAVCGHRLASRADVERAFRSLPTQPVAA